MNVALRWLHRRFMALYESEDRQQVIYYCMGALDKKHIAIRLFYESGLVYHNYKEFAQIIMLAFMDADYRFT